MKLLTKKQMLVRIAIIVLPTEFFIMLLFGVSSYQSDAMQNDVLGKLFLAFFDAVLLALVSTPAIYIWITKPFVHARDEALAQISHLAYVDPLTKLANRRLLLEHLEKAIAGSIRHKDYGAVLIIDLDRFKVINDQHGHEAGDAVLVEIAERLQSSLRPEDVVSRLGGDEFVVLVHRLGIDESVARENAMQIAKKLVHSVVTPFYFNGETLHVGASIGICLLGFEELSAEAAMREADIAMYRAKNTGGGCALFADK